MSDNNDDHKEQRIGLWLVGGAVALTTLAVLLFTVYGWENGKIEGAPANEHAASATMPAAASAVAASETAAQLPQPSESPSTAASATSAAASMASSPADMIVSSATEQSASETDGADSANVVVENGVVKFYFATGKSDLAGNAAEALHDVLAGVKEGKKAVISGYNDSTGNMAANEKLSKQRAFAVRNALLSLGVPENQIELRKPADTEAGKGNDAEARRVEVILE